MVAQSNSNTTKIRNADLLAVRAYVTAQDGQQQHSDTQVLVDLTHSNLQQRFLEIRLDKHMPLKELYHLFHQKSGSAVDDQILQVVYDHDDMPSTTLPSYDSPDASRPIAYFLREFTIPYCYRIHCIDRNPHAISARGALENTDLVEKFVLTDPEYDARRNTLRAWARTQKEQDPNFTLQRHAEQHRAQQEAVRRHKLGLPLPGGFELVNGAVVAKKAPAADEEEDDFGETSVQHCRFGDRCQIQPGHRRGRVAWVGSIPNTTTASNSQQTEEVKPSYWVGIVLDEPVGLNDGTFARTGKRYFDAPPKYGVFCRGKNVETGDFPERDILLEDSSDEEL